MILKKLKLQNFKKYESLEIEFKEGLTGIVGKNGAGKSTIFEAILFCLYGELKNKGDKDIIRNANVSAKEVVSATLVFELDNTRYEIHREFRGKALSANAKLYVNKDLLIKGAKEVSAYITKLCQMSKEAFISTLFSSQKELSSLSSLKNEDRKRMIRKLLGLEKIDFVQNELVLKARTLKREIITYDEILLAEDEVESKNSKISELNDLIVGLVEEKTSKKEEEKVLNKLEENFKKSLFTYRETKHLKLQTKGEYELTKSTINAKNEYLNKVLNEEVELKTKQNELDLLKNVKEEYKSLHKSISIHINNKERELKKEALVKEQVVLRVQYIKSKNDFDDLRAQCSVYSDLLIKEKEIELQKDKSKKALDEVMSKISDIDVNIRSNENTIGQTQDKINKLKSLGDKSPCPVCTRPLLNEYDKVLNDLSCELIDIQDKHIERYKKDLSAENKKRTILEEKNNSINKNYSNIEKEINLLENKKIDLLKAQEYFEETRDKGLKNKELLENFEDTSYDLKSHLNDNKRFEELKEKYEYVLQLETLLKRADILKEEINRTNKDLKILNEKVKKEEKTYLDINYDESEHLKCDLEYQKSTKDLKTALNVISSLNVQEASLNGEIKTIQAILNKNNKELKKVQNKKDDLLDYEQIKISLEVFKNKLNEKVAPRISQLSSSMFSLITKGKYEHIEVNNDFDFFIYDKGIKYPITRFSGGEIDLANLVLRICISKTLSELSGSSRIEFLAFDEVFGSQDQNRRAMILEAFYTIKEQYRQIFLISHENDIKEMFENVIEL